jgi:hypothetical protein
LNSGSSSLATSSTPRVSSLARRSITSLQVAGGELYFEGNDLARFEVGEATTHKAGQLIKS